MAPSCPGTRQMEGPCLQLIGMGQSGSNKKVANSLVAVSCAAVLAVYSAGYARTRSAASHFDEQATKRRLTVSSPQQPIAPSAPASETARVEPPVASRPGRGQPEPAAVARVAEAPAVPTPVETAAPSLTPPTVAPPPPLPVAEVAAAVAPPAPPPAPAAPPTPPPPPAPKWKDGTFTGWGTSRHGDIEATVLIEGGRILSATISQCHTRYSCSVIDMLPPQPPQRQSPEVDFVSRATESADAFYYALVEALGKAK